MRPLSRNTAIAGSVLLFHVAALWALQTGLLRKAVEVIVPVSVLSDIITPPVPKVEPPPPPPPPPRPQPKPVEKPVVVRKSAPPPPPAPQPVAIPDPTPAPNAPTGVLTPQPPAPPIAAPVSPAGPPGAGLGTTAGPARVELPSSDADYLQNPKPAYPPISKRLGEQGKVVVRVLIGADGMPQRAEIRQSSGFDRLDQSALATALRWRYVPGKRAGVPETMWFNVPINFVLE